MCGGVTLPKTRNTCTELHAVCSRASHVPFPDATQEYVRTRVCCNDHHRHANNCSALAKGTTYVFPLSSVLPALSMARAWYSFTNAVHTGQLLCVGKRPPLLLLTHRFSTLHLASIALVVKPRTFFISPAEWFTIPCGSCRGVNLDMVRMHFTAAKVPPHLSLTKMSPASLPLGRPAYASLGCLRTRNTKWVFMKP